ncbi:hypothetical protein PG996_009213 [Apiospora saccharicola]|uniref:Uncharacterized protein n=1 Tax=Apiospora saccharicola TaxID=335842 RepID=A0ABR1UN16_9PEZI
MRRQRVHRHVLSLVDLVDVCGEDEDLVVAGRDDIAMAVPLGRGYKSGIGHYIVDRSSSLRASHEKTLLVIPLFLGLFELGTLSQVLGVVELGSLVIEPSVKASNVLLQALNVLQGSLGLRGEVGRRGCTFDLVGLEL